MNPQDSQPVNPQQQVIERLRTAVNVLVTVSNNPSVDQLAGAIGFTLMLNKMGKHATTVFSGAVPSTIEFLKPDETIEKNTDSLRDFIVSLDKSKADKLRYKVEQNVVKIFITPYHTSISEKDLEFSQGDFNVDVVLALGITDRRDLDQAITAHGRILHDATVITVSAGNKNSSLGAINWQDAGAASLCEMLVGVGETLQANLLDTQQATAFLTGIVAETNRFSNEKTTPKIMSLASQLMAAGANQQLIATQLDKATEVPLKASTPMPASASPDGALTIEHNADQLPKLAVETKKEEPDSKEKEEAAKQIAIDEHGNMSEAAPSDSYITKHRTIQPLAGQDDAGKPDSTFTAAMEDGDEDQDKTTSAPLPARDQETFTHDKTEKIEPLKDEPAPKPAKPYVPAPDVKVPPMATVPDDSINTIPPAMDDNTLRDIEKNVDSPHIVKDPTTTLHEMEEFVGSSHLTNQETGDMVMTPPTGGVDAARDAVNSAISAAPYDATRPEPLKAVNSVPLPSASPTTDPILKGLGLTDSPQGSSGMTLPPVPSSSVSDPSGPPPPPVPPPMVPMQ